MRKGLKIRLAPLVILAAFLSTPMIQHAWKLHTLFQAAHAEASKAATTGFISGKPVRIIVPAAAVDIAVVPGMQDPATRQWAVSPNFANYATSTAPANNRNGQTLIYGHATSRVFGPLTGLKPGDQAVVYTDNRHTLIYTFSSGYDVTPDQTDIFSTFKKGAGLVLMTCDGDHYQYRRVMDFKLTKAS